MATPAEVELPPVQPRTIFPVKEQLVDEQQALVAENARLSWENAMLRQQAENSLQRANQMMVSDGSWWLPQDPWAAAEAAQAGLEPGVTVALHGLKSASELNGVHGVVQCFDDESGRWVVRLPDGEDKFAKAENLIVVSGSEGFYYEGYPQCYYNEGSMYDSWDYFGGEDMPARRSRARTSSSAKGPAGKTRAATSSFSSDKSTAVGSSCPSSFSDDGVEEPTTVMMRNIPNNYTREMLLDLLNSHGFKNSYNLVYLPIDFQTEVGLGYAFINLTGDVQHFRDHFHGFSDWQVASQKVCHVSWSNPLQGIQAHIDRYRNSPVMHESVPDEYKPMLFVNGERVAFPAPTKRIRPPRLRRPGPSLK